MSARYLIELVSDGLSHLISPNPVGSAKFDAPAGGIHRPERGYQYEFNHPAASAFLGHPGKNVREPCSTHQNHSAQAPLSSYHLPNASPHGPQANELG